LAYAIEVPDWTGDEPGLPALWAIERNRLQARRIAGQITQYRQDHPHCPVYLIGVSGGSALVVWALAFLPEDVQVQDVVLLMPALSPGYDLTAALRRVAGRMHVFSSTGDTLVLGVGTRNFGTMDGVKCNAAGRVGFQRPP